MRLSWGLVLGLALGASAGRIAPRQNVASTTGPSPAASSIGGGSEPTTPTSTSSSSSSSSSSISTPSSSAGGGDTTVFVTATVTSAGGGSTVSETTTVTASSVTTVTITTTDIATTTITMTDGETSTRTVFVTSTQTVNMKRRSVGNVLQFNGNGPAHVDAQPTAAATATGIPSRDLSPERIGIEKRAVVTSTVTVTVGGGGSATTVTQTVTKNVRSTTTTVVHTTSLITETYQANAKTTVTVTSTIVTKLTVVSTGVVESTSTPTGSPNPPSNDDNNGGLSTGAKAGIGVGAGVAGLAIIGALLWFFTRRRRGPKPDPDDLLGPSSEVPVGAGGSRPMSEGLASTPGSVPRRSPVLPNVQPEGYRGTAKGDGRAGYAKPEPYGAAYAPTRSTTNSSYPPRSGTLSPGDQLPRHPTPDTTTVASVSPLSARPQTAELGNDGAGARWHTSEAAEMASDNPAAAKWHSDNAHEIDSHAVMSHQSGPVYEMPTEHFK
ncbi:hypothetical protein MGU_01750 [Metarhizium guizhouense ARSEF 977]|uniref:Uncharacterized protein n=1 Tax=Metarhizium guizhouense (strain ARSEF 977) TaxID=1276136 RepID=A0A0B4GW67_METGA|nr:hypothetical protein MGU_01750 [Metarhizium guizhouense ARSEF 977]